MNRYDNLTKAIDELCPVGGSHLKFLEVGTYTGDRAAQLMRYWLKTLGRSVSYFGFDLFEEMDQATNTAELSKAKLPPSCETVQRMLSGINRAKIQLFRGNTRETLKTECPRLGRMDLVFMDGGHSLETIDSDWQNLQPVIDAETIVLLDDYYLNRRDFGCQVLVERLQADPAYSVALLDPVDHFEHTQLDIRMVRVQRVET